MRIYLVLSFLFSALFFWTAIASSSSETPDSLEPSGTILINVYMSSNGMDGFKLTFPRALLEKTYEGEEIIDPEKGKSIPRSASYQAYLDAFKKEREYRFALEKKIAHMFAGYDLSSLDTLYFSLKRECDPNFRTTLEKSSLPLHEMTDIKQFPSKNFSPNRQLTFAFYHPFSYGLTPTTGSGLLINLRTKEISYPFCGDFVGMFEWSPDGRYIAYACHAPKSVRSRVLVIKDVMNNETLFRRNLGKDIYDIIDIAWEPRAQHIAIMSISSRLGILPWELLGLIAGHAVSYNDIFLEIYNLKGEREYHYEIVRNKKDASGKIVWTTE